MGILKTTWPLRYCVHHDEPVDDWPPLCESTAKEQ